MSWNFGTVPEAEGFRYTKAVPLLAAEMTRPRLVGVAKRLPPKLEGVRGPKGERRICRRE